MTTTYVRVPVLELDGAPIDPDLVAYPLQIAAGRSRIQQQPEPATLTFTMPVATEAQAPKRGQEITVDLPTTDLRLFRGRVTNITAQHDPWQAGSVNGFTINALGWSTTYATSPIDRAWKIGVKSEQDQFEEVLWLWDDQAGYDLTTPPIDLDGLDDTHIRHAYPIEQNANLLATLQDLAAWGGATVWEHPTGGILIQGADVRESTTTTAGTIPADLLELPIRWDPADIINNLRVGYGAWDQFAATATYTEPRGIFEWDRGGATPGTGQAVLNGGATLLKLHRTDFNGVPQSGWISELQYGDVIVCRHLTADTYAGFLITAWPTWYSSRVEIPVLQLDGNWDPAEAAGDYVALWPSPNAPRATTTISDSASETIHGTRSTSTDTGLALITPATARGNQIVDRWAVEQWVATINVRTDLATSQTQWDDVLELLQPNTAITTAGLYSSGGALGPFDNQVWLEGVVHTFDKTDGGRVTHNATIVVTQLAESVAEGLFPSSETYPSSTTYPGAA